MIFTGTRSALVGTAFGLLFLTIFVVIRRKDLWIKWVILAITFSAIFVGVDAKEDGGNYKRAMTSVTESYQIVTNQTTGHEGSSRWFIWEKSFPLIFDYFWIGSGPDTLEFVFPATKQEKKKILYNPDAVVDKAHNEYLQMAITLGVPALLIYLIMVLFIINYAFKAIRTSIGQDNLLLYGMLGAVLGYLIQAFFNISVVPVAPLFWILLGFTYSLSNLYIQKANTFVNSSKYSTNKENINKFV
jgi:putative inorganic carbon (HCO3(-)) transporter